MALLRSHCRSEVSEQRASTSMWAGEGRAGEGGLGHMDLVTVDKRLASPPKRFLHLVEELICFHGVSTPSIGPIPHKPTRHASVEAHCCLPCILGKSLCQSCHPSLMDQCLHTRIPQHLARTSPTSLSPTGTANNSTTDIMLACTGTITEIHLSNMLSSPSIQGPPCPT